MTNAVFLFLWNVFFPPAPMPESGIRNYETPIALNRASAPPATAAALGSCFNEEFCLYGKPDGNGNIVITVHTVAQGWVGVGVGNEMSDSFMFVAWRNSSGGFTISDRSPADHVQPGLAPNQLSKIVPTDSSVLTPSWAKISFSFSRPIASADVTFSPSSSYIYAFAKSKKPNSLDNPAAAIAYHSDFNIVGNLDIVGSVPVPTTTRTTSAPSPSTTAASSAVSGKCIGTTFCLYGQPDGSGNVLFTIHSSAKGWVGFGTGSGMAGSSMTVAWKNSAGGVTISDRLGSGHVLPSATTSISSIVPLKIAKPDWANIAFSFLKPISATSYSLTATSRYIYADSPSAPSSPDSSSSSFGIHSNFAALGSLDFVSSAGSGVVETTSTAPAVPPASTSAATGATSKCVPNTFCIYGEPDGSGNVLITVHSSASGWAAFGVGSSMSSATIIVGWKNTQGGYSISDRISKSQSLPSYSSAQQSTLVALKHAAPSWAKLAFTIRRPLKSVDVTITSASPYIYAFSNTAPSSPNSPSSAFVQHDSFGFLGALDFTTNAGSQGTAPSGSGSAGAGSSSVGVVPSNGGIGSICIANIYCVYSEPDGNGNVYISLVSAANGWVALGVGSVMTASPMIIGWSNSTGGTTVTDRKAAGYTLPGPITTNSRVVAFRATKPAWATLAFTILRPLSTPDMTFTPTTSFIYAYSSTAPNSIDSPSSSFGIHSGRGSLGVLDFTTLHNGTATSSAENTNVPVANGTIANNTGNDGVGSVCIPDEFCVYSDPDLQGNVYITIQSALGGWVGLGTGDSMTGSIMLIGWKNSTGGYTVSDRQATAEAMPSASTSAKSIVVPLRVPSPPWATLSFTVFRPIQGDYTANTRFIYAASKNTPASADSSSSSFSIHEKYSLLGALDFTTKHDGVKTTSGSGSKSILELPAGVEYSTVVRLHGYIMIYSWVVCPIVAIFIARYLKSKLGHAWFQLHVLIMVGGTAVGTIAAILLIVLFKPGSAHFTSIPSIHPLLGLLISIMMVLQMALGVASDKLWSPDRASIPWWDKAHWWLGRGSVVLAFANIWTGIVYTDNFSSFAMALPVLFGLFVAGGVAAFTYGELKLGQIHHVAGSSINSSSSGNLLKDNENV